jgi:hypothetical protein
VPSCPAQAPLVFLSKIFEVFPLTSFLSFFFFLLASLFVRSRDREREIREGEGEVFGGSAASGKRPTLAGHGRRRRRRHQRGVFLKPKQWVSDF